MLPSEDRLAIRHLLPTTLAINSKQMKQSKEMAKFYSFLSDCGAYIWCNLVRIGSHTGDWAKAERLAKRTNSFFDLLVRTFTRRSSHKNADGREPEKAIDTNTTSFSFPWYSSTVQTWMRELTRFLMNSFCFLYGESIVISSFFTPAALNCSRKSKIRLHSALLLSPLLLFPFTWMANALDGRFDISWMLCDVQWSRKFV